MQGTASHLAEWLRAFQTLPEEKRERWLLRGSLLTATLLQGAGLAPGRAPADVDYVVLGEFDPQHVLHVANEVLLGTSTLALLGWEIIWGQTQFPGVRLWIDVVGTARTMTVDCAFHDPLSRLPQTLSVLGVSGVSCCAGEDLWGWKLHGLVEFGYGRWRAKDLYDLARLSELEFETADLRRAAELAFASRGLALASLDDFRQRTNWGESFSSGRKWRSFCRKAGVEADLLWCREKVRQRAKQLWSVELRNTRG